MFSDKVSVCCIKQTETAGEKPSARTLYKLNPTDT